MHQYNTYFFCQNIRRLRMEHKFSQKQMASMLGIGVKSLRLLERNIIPP